LRNLVPPTVENCFADPFEHATHAPMPSEQQPSVLILEDDPTTSSALQVLLSRHGYKPVLARSVRDAMKVIGGQPFAILDLLLPDGSGMEVLREIRDKYPSTRVLISSGCCDPSSEKEIGELGAILHPKPISLPRILEWLRQPEPAE
jgi:DNA-binding response OmpR family regulator